MLFAEIGSEQEGFQELGRREGAMEASELYDCYSEVKDLLAYLIEGRFLDSTHWIVLSVGKSRENPSPKLT